MELFEKVYNCYYKAVAEILKRAGEQPVTRAEMEETARKYGYEESAMTIVPKLLNGEWPLLREKEKHLYEPLLPVQKLPLTKLQQSWLRTLLEDSRILLFLNTEELELAKAELSPMSPLFEESDFHYFDRYLDGDDYTCAEYQTHFRTILEALEKGLTISVTYLGKNDRSTVFDAAPYQLQYSSKDDKFRLCCLGLNGSRLRKRTILNLNRMTGCRLSHKPMPLEASALRFQPIQKSPDPVLLEISGERNSLERCMLHFANYEKQTSFDEEKGTYLCTIYYDMADETELLIEILSFGPVVRVLGPEPFLAQVRKRVKRQHELLYDRTD